MTQYMLLFSLGPVQSFIAQARKTRDLWLGSFLLSVLMEAGMKGIESALVFPGKPVIENNIPDLPNKYIAIFNDFDEAKQAATQSKQQIETCWNEICEDVWREVVEAPARFSRSITRTMWEKQIDPANVFEIFWVVVEGTPEQYKQWLQETQAAFDGRKRLRDFRQLEEFGEKSTISGEHAALHGIGDLRTDVQMFWYEVAKGLKAKDINKDGTERLGAIDTVKRFAYLSRRLKAKQLNGVFPSTSSVTTATYIERLITASNDSQSSQVIQRWLDETGNLEEVLTAIPFLENQAGGQEQAQTILKRDGDCYFPETFSSYHLRKSYAINPINKAEELAEKGGTALRKLLKATDTLEITRPTSYYAMIQMDGDRMGTLLNDVKDKDEHTAISKALSDFSRGEAVKTVQERYPGRLIYAGGDDVFALAPLARDYVQLETTKEGASGPIKTVLDLVDQLQQQYRTIVRPVVQNAEPASSETDEKSRKDQVTASTGIAIAHHYTSLSYVRRMSKDAENLAKEHYGRNALVVTVLRRSGEQTRVGCHWQYPGLIDEAQPIALFLSFYDLFKGDVLSPKCIYNLLEEAPALVGLDRDAQCSEIKRVLRRQRSTGMEKKLPDNEIPKKADYLIKLAEAMDNAPYPILKKEQKLPSVELHADERRYGLVEVLDWLLVMLFLTRKEQE